MLSDSYGVYNLVCAPARSAWSQREVTEKGTGIRLFGLFNMEYLFKKIDEEPGRNVTPLHTHQWKEAKRTHGLASERAFRVQRIARLFFFLAWETTMIKGLGPSLSGQRKGIG